MPNVLFSKCVKSGIRIRKKEKENENNKPINNNKNNNHQSYYTRMQQISTERVED